MSDKSYSERLDALLTAIEDSILAAPDDEWSPVRDPDVEETRAFICARVAETGTELPPRVPRRRSRRALAVRTAIPKDPVGRRRLLGRLVASRAEVPAHISMAFESREPDDAEIAEMLEELLREGMKPVTE